MTLQERKISDRVLLLGIFFAAGLALLFTSLAPPEATLGDNVRLVYLHASLTWVGMVLFGLASISAVVFLVSKGRLALCWAETIWSISLGVWFFNILISILTMLIIWGAVAWDEPRFRIVLIILAVALAVKALTTFVENRAVSALIYGISFLPMAGLLLNQAAVLHPTGAITGAESSSIKIAVVGISLSLLSTALLASVLTIRRLTNNAIS